MNIAHIEEHSHIYGPGSRFVIWVQGCSLHCKGCWNQSMWSFQEKDLIPKEIILKQILDNQNDIEGISILGGEPLDQTEEVIWLLKSLRQYELSTVLFTGYELDELYKNPEKKEALAFTDILISGRFKQEKRTTLHQWIGSTNQEVHFLSSKYDSSIIQNSNYVEVIIDDSGQLNVLGFPDSELLKIVK
jgi:anaerobic ribonucleoside-triphosphate reductase activating protein